MSVILEFTTPDGNFVTVKGVRVIERDAFRAALERSVGSEVENREVNVLLMTAEAADLGEYEAGRRGYQTRLILSDGFEDFADRLANEYRLPPGGGARGGGSSRGARGGRT